MKLYEIAKSFIELQTRLENDDIGEDTKQAIADTLEGLDFSLEEKTENIIKIIRNQESDISAVDNEIKRLQDLKKSKQNNIESLKSYLLNNLVGIGKDKVETALFRVTVKNNPPKVNIVDEHEVPAEYMKITYTVDKSGLKQDLMNEEKAAELNKLGITLVQDKCLMIK